MYAKFPLSIAFAAALGAASPALAQDASKGGVLFKQRCQACHSATPGARPGAGPNLSGVKGRAAASTAFAYSPDLKNSKLVWDAKTLDAYLAAPSKLVPGTRMVVSLPNPAQRADVVAYLLGLK